MRLFSKKGAESSSFGLVIGMILGLALIALVIGLLVVTKTEALNQEFASQMGCYLTNTVKCKGGILSEIPTLCMYETVEDPVDLEKFADLTRDTWWMYKEGTCDFGNAADEIFPAYAITAAEDISIPEFFAYILKNNRGRVVEDIEYSDYSYLEENTEGQTLCFDSSVEESSITEELYLEKGETYYMLFYDDQPIAEEGDKILISTSPEFDAGYWKEIGTGVLVGVGLVVVAVGTAGAGVAIYTGGITAASGIVAGAELAITAYSATATTAVITGVGGAGASTFYITSDNTDGECLVYGPGEPDE